MRSKLRPATIGPSTIPIRMISEENPITVPKAARPKYSARMACVIGPLEPNARPCTTVKASTPVSESASVSTASDAAWPSIATARM